MTATNPSHSIGTLNFLQWLLKFLNCYRPLISLSKLNEFLPDENYDVIFSSGTLQYLLPDKRKKIIEAYQKNTNPQGLNIFHTFVSKPFIERAPDAESNEYLWSSGELLLNR